MRVDNRVMRVSSPVFVGRGEEVAALRAAFERAVAGRAQTVFLAGDSGVGKSRLLEHFRDGVGQGRWLAGDCIALAEGELPYAPLTAALRGAALETGDLPLSLDSSPELARGRLFEQVLATIGELSAEGAVVLAIEDLHWADRSTRDLLSFLIRAARDQALLLICTYRSDELHPRHPLRPFLAEHKRLASVEMIELAAFTPAELEAQLEGILGAEPAPALARRLFERSEGNAFYAEELLAASASGDVLPPTVRDALMLRVESVPQDSREVLRVAAAAARPIPHQLLVAAAALPEPRLSAAVRELVEHQLLVPDAEPESYAFRHALLAETISADLLPGERARLHLALAEALAADPRLAESASAAGELAFHWRACHRDNEALAASAAAARQAEASGAFAEANRHLENVLELWDRVDDPERRAGLDHGAVLLRAAEAANLDGRTPRAVELARSAVAEADGADEPVRGAHARDRLGEFLWLSGDSEAAITVLREAAEMLPAEPPTVERARALAAEARILMVHGHAAESSALCDEAISIARRLRARPEEGHALNTLGCNLLLIGERTEAIARLGEAKRIAEECFPEDLWRAYGNLAEALDHDGQLEEAVALGIEGAERSRPLGQYLWCAYILGHLTSQLVRLGRLDEAEKFVRVGLDTPTEGIDRAALLGVSAEINLHRGALEAAQAELELALAEAGMTADVMIRPRLTDRLALLAVVSGDPDRAASIVAEALATMDENEYLAYTARMHTLALRAHADAAERARALGDAGRVADAERSGAGLLQRLRDLLSEDRWPGSPPPESVARGAVAAAELERLRGAPAAELWSIAARHWAELGFTIELSYSRWREAEAILAAGGPKAEAAERLHEAARLAWDASAAGLAGEIEALAARARIGLEDDAPSGRPVAAGVAERFGLTDRELEVLALIAEGRTNPEIAEALFIAPKTASAHVSHILAKLDVRSRVEAATTAHKLDLVSRAKTTDTSIEGR